MVDGVETRRDVRIQHPPITAGAEQVYLTSAEPIGVACASLIQDGFPDHDPAAWLRWNGVTVNCALTTLIVGRSGIRLLSFNEHGHVPPACVSALGKSAHGEADGGVLSEAVITGRPLAGTGPGTGETSA